MDDLEHYPSVLIAIFSRQILPEFVQNAGHSQNTHYHKAGFPLIIGQMNQLLSDGLCPCSTSFFY